MSVHRLALFDCDGTLADSQREIVTAMVDAFAACGMEVPSAAAMRSIIGLSVERAMAVLVPDCDPAFHDQLGDAYREAYFAHRTAVGARPEPLYDGIVDVLGALAANGWMLGIATGKSQRGLLRLLAAHRLIDRFVTLQTADFHPSKPDPSMARAAMAEAGARAATTVVVGDTAYDMAMARSAGAIALGVGWGYHSEAELRAAGAVTVAASPHDLPALLETLVVIA
jgi:phosphoglycolate phosphatase